MKTLYLHIGTYKTATTSIQFFCTRNNEVLNRKGYIYPESPFKYPAIDPRKNGHFICEVKKDSEGNPLQGKNSPRFIKGINRIHDVFQEYDNVIVSDESIWANLYLNDAQVLRDLLKDSQEYNYQIKMIIYLRRQDDFLESWWNQRIKNNTNVTIPFKDFVEEYPHLDYYKILSIYADLIGDENLYVRRFDEVKRKENGIIGDFLMQIGLELTEEYKSQDLYVNTGLYGHNVEIKRVINELEEINKTEAKLIVKALRMNSKVSKQQYRSSEFSESERRSFLQQFETSNDALTQRFFDDGQPAFSTDYSDAPKRDNQDSEFLNDIIRGFAASVILLNREQIHMCQDIQQIQQKHHQLYQEQDELKKQIQKLQSENKKQKELIESFRHPIRTLLKKIKHLFQK